MFGIEPIKEYIYRKQMGAVTVWLKRLSDNCKYKIAALLFVADESGYRKYLLR